MAKLTTAQRNRLPASAFAGPDRTYPVPDASHARNAISRAAQMRKRGLMDAATEQGIVSKARGKLRT